METDRAQALFESLVTLGTTYGVRILGVLFALVIALRIAGWTRSLVEKSLSKAKFDPTLTRFFANSSRWGVLLLATLGCLGVFGIETTSFAAVIGAAGLSIGLAFQGTLSSFSAGIMLLIFRPFKVGDIVQVSGDTGTVEAIDLFTTSLDTPDNRRIILPNSSVFGSTIENLSFHPERRVDVEVGTDYGADLDATRKILETAAGTVPKQVSGREPQIFLASLGGSSVDWQVRVWCHPDDYWAVKEATTRATKMALDEAGIGIPFPQLDVHLDPPMPT